MKINYDKINDALNEFAVKNSSLFFFENYYGIANLAYRIESMWYDITKSENIGQKDIEPTIFLDGFTSVEIARSYLGTLNKGYEETFDTYLKDGTIDFVNINDDNIYDSKESLAGTDVIGDNIHKKINIALEHNYNDPIIIVHEFFHLQNLQKKVTETRMTLTELISIYFEDKCLEYMESLGYDQKEITKVRLKRQENTFLCSRDYLKFIDVFNVFNQLGNIDEKTFNNKDDMYTEIFPDTSKEWEDELTEFNSSIKNDRPIRSLVASRYIFCDSISKYLRQNDSAQLSEKMLNLNEVINEDAIGRSLASVGVYFDDSLNDKLMLAYEKEVKRKLFQFKG